MEKTPHATVPRGVEFSRALALSLVFHALILSLLAQFSVNAAVRKISAALALEVRLNPPAELATLPEPSPLELQVTEPVPPVPSVPSVASAKIQPERQRPTPQIQNPPSNAKLPYPLEAIALNLEGDVLVRVTLDPQGKVSARTLEKTSGHALLDYAALRAVETLRAPAGTPGEFVLPVRFRLK